MIIEGINNQTVEFKIHDFEQDDPSWFYIYLKVKSSHGSWEVTDPFWEVYDIPNIIKWFRDWSENKPVESNPLSFLEPNILFEVLKHDINVKLLRIIFRSECRPQPSEEFEYFVDCSLTNDQLLKMSIELLEEYRRFIKEN